MWAPQPQSTVLSDLIWFWKNCCRIPPPFCRHLTFFYLSHLCFAKSSPPRYTVLSRLRSFTKYTTSHTSTWPRWWLLLTLSIRTAPRLIRLRYVPCCPCLPLHSSFGPRSLCLIALPIVLLSRHLDSCRYEDMDVYEFVESWLIEFHRTLLLQTLWPRALLFRCLRSLPTPSQKPFLAVTPL